MISRQRARAETISPSNGVTQNSIDHPRVTPCQAGEWLESPGTDPGEKWCHNMESSYEGTEQTSKVLPAHAALIPAASRLDGAPHKGWYFAVLVRAAYSRLEGSA